MRTAMAETPEESLFTGAKDRMDDMSAKKTASRKRVHSQKRTQPGTKSGWLSPVEANESSNTVGPDVQAPGHPLTVAS